MVGVGGGIVYGDFEVGAGVERSRGAQPAAVAITAQPNNVDTIQSIRITFVGYDARTKVVVSMRLVRATGPGPVRGLFHGARSMHGPSGEGSLIG